MKILDKKAFQKTNTYRNLSYPTKLALTYLSLQNTPLTEASLADILALDQGKITRAECYARIRKRLLAANTPPKP